MTRVVVHIDRLVVSGAADRRELAAAVSDAIRRELARPGAAEALGASGDRARVDAGRVGAGSAAIGSAIARSLTKGGPR